jgi:tetratricopeptide (TPR) repeat protein
MFDDPDHPGREPPAPGVDPYDPDQLRDLLEVRPHDWRVWFRLALLLLDRGTSEGFPEARAAMERVVALVPDNGLARYHLCRACLATDDADAALEAARETARLRPAYVPAWRMVGAILSRRRKWADALEAWQRVAQLDPDGDTFWQISRCMVRLHRFREALVTLEEAVRREPRHRLAHQALALLGRFHDESDVASRHLQRLFEIDEAMARDLQEKLEELEDDPAWTRWRDRPPGQAG